MKKTIGFIGLGNMGTPMISRLISSGLVPADSILAYDIDSNKMNELKTDMGITCTSSVQELAKRVDYIILAVKPNVCEKVLQDMQDALNDKKILISIAAGVSIQFYKNILGSSHKIVRAMPNTPAQIGEGMTLLCGDNLVSADEMKEITAVFDCFGKTEYLPESLMSEVIALTSSSPAYVFVMLEAMADAAVQSGIPRAMAYRLAAQTLQGSAKLVLETGTHPAVLKDNVCSPGGTTIEAVAKLEETGFRSSIIEAMKACTNKAKG